MFEQANNPHYLKSNKVCTAFAAFCICYAKILCLVNANEILVYFDWFQDMDKNADDIPVVRFHLNIPLQIQGK